MSFADNLNGLSREQVNTLKQRQGTKPFVLIISVHTAIFFRRAKILTGCGDSLNTRFLVTGDGMNVSA